MIYSVCQYTISEGLISTITDSFFTILIPLALDYQRFTLHPSYDRYFERHHHPQEDQASFR